MAQTCVTGGDKIYIEKNDVGYRSTRYADTGIPNWFLDIMEDMRVFGNKE